ncbi:unnamed protein product, partial [Symbiodinium microadriaticum]
ILASCAFLQAESARPPFQVEFRGGSVKSDDWEGELCEEMGGICKGGMCSCWDGYFMGADCGELGGEYDFRISHLHTDLAHLTAPDRACSSLNTGTSWCLNHEKLSSHCREAGGLPETIHLDEPNGRGRFQELRCRCTTGFSGRDCDKELLRRKWISLEESEPHHVQMLLTHSKGDCKCRNREDTLKSTNAFEHIKNDALKFCTGLFSLATPANASRDDRDEVANRVKRALGKFAEAQKICQTALDQQVTTKVADEELLGIKKGLEDREPGPKTRAYQVLDGENQTGHVWKELLKKVCADECGRIVFQTDKWASGLALRSVQIDSGIGSLSEYCAQRVVSIAEAEVLTCCEQECLWDSDDEVCLLWPFFDDSQKLDWNARCCAEGTILKNSSRERLCNSVLPKEKREKLRQTDVLPAQH